MEPLPCRATRPVSYGRLAGQSSPHWPGAAYKDIRLPPDMRKPKRGQNMDKALKIIWLIQFEELQQELFIEMRKRYKTGTGCSAVVVINRIVHSRWLPNLWTINKIVLVRRCLSAIDGEYLLSGEAYRLFFEFLVSPRNYIQSLTEVLYRTHGASYHKIYFHIFSPLSIIAIELTLLTQGLGSARGNMGFGSWVEEKMLWSKSILDTRFVCESRRGEQTTNVAD